MEAVSVLTDKEEVKNLLAKGNITDIGEFMKTQALAHPELVPDPEAFNEAWDRQTAAAVVKEFSEKAPERIGSKRAELLDALSKYNQSLVDAWNQATPRQKCYGQVASKLSDANSMDDITKVFTWADIQFGDFTLAEKCLAILQGAQLIGTKPENYRGNRKIFFAMIANNDIEIPAEWFEAKNGEDAAQKAIASKLLKVKSIPEIEEIFDWAEIQLDRQIIVADRYFIFLQIAQVINCTDEIFKTIKKILIRMNKD